MTDAEFKTAVEKILNSDRTGLRDIYDAYGDKIYRLFLGRLKNHQDAEDLTSDFFLKLWDVAKFYHVGQGHRCWLTTIARNMAIDYQRRASRNIPVEDTEILQHETFTEHRTAEDMTIGKLYIHRLLASLSEEEQEIVQLHIGAELTFREIALIIKRPLGTVAWKYRNAIGKLQKLAKEGQLI